MWRSINSWISSWSRWVYNSLSGLIRFTWSVTWNAVSWLGGRVWGFVQWLYSGLTRVVGDVGNAIKSFVNSVVIGARNLLSALINGMWMWLRWSFSSLRDLLSGLFKSLSESFTRALGDLGKLTGQWFTLLLKHLLGARDFLWGKLETAFGHLRLMIDGGFRQITGGIGDFARTVADAIGKVWSGLVATLGQEKASIAFSLAEIIKAIGKILQPIYVDLVNSVKKLGFRLFGPGSPGINVFNVPGSVEYYVSRASELVSTYNAYAFALASLTLMAEAASLGQIDFTLEGFWHVPNIAACIDFATKAAVAEWDYILNNVLPLAWAAKYTPVPPDPEIVIEAYMAGEITYGQLINALKASGYSEHVAKLMVNAAYSFGGVDDLMAMYWRGLLREDALKHILRRYKFSPYIVDKLIEAKKKVPGASDLINFVVREVIPPEEFKKYMQWQGYEEFWADYYWEAHWRLPSLETIAEQFFRGYLTETELRKYLVWHDYKPTPRPGIHVSDVDIMVQHLYKWPERIDSRWAWEWGIISDEEFKKLVEAEGIHPDWVDKVAEARKKNVLRDEINRVRSELVDQYAKGYITRETLAAELEKLGFIKRVIDLTLLEADLKRKAYVLDKKIDAVIYRYRKKIIDRDSAVAELKALGLAEDVASVLVEVEVARRGEA